MTRLLHTAFPSPVGNITLFSDGEALLRLTLEGQRLRLPTAPSERYDDLPLFIQTCQWLRDYFNGERPNPRTIPLRPQGSPFRLAIWELLLEIPYGTTTTYGAIAREYLHRHHPESADHLAHYAQAVGNAVGHNPIAIIIPCHRVMGANGSLTGYNGGLALKKKLLEGEQP